MKKKHQNRPAAQVNHDDVIKWTHYTRYWPFVRGIHRWPVNSPNKGLWHGALMFSFIYVWINGRVNNREAGDLRRHRAHYDVIVMKWNLGLSAACCTTVCWGWGHLHPWEFKSIDYWCISSKFNTKWISNFVVPPKRFWYKQLMECDRYCNIV